MPFFEENKYWFWNEFDIQKHTLEAMKIIAREAMPIMADAVKIEKFIISSTKEWTSTLNISRIKWTESKFKIRVNPDFIKKFTKNIYDYAWMISHEISHYSIGDFLRQYPYVRHDVLNVASDAYINARLFHLNPKLADWTRRIYKTKESKDTVFSILRNSTKLKDIPTILKPIYLKLYWSWKIITSLDEIVRVVDLYMNLEKDINDFKSWKNGWKGDWDILWDMLKGWTPWTYGTPFIWSHDREKLDDINTWLDYINDSNDWENPYFSEFKKTADYSDNFYYYKDYLNDKEKEKLYNPYLEEIIKWISEESILRDIRKSFASENIITESFIPTANISAKNLYLFKNNIYPTFSQPALVNKFLNIFVDVSWSLYDKVSWIFKLVQTLEKEINVRVFAMADWIIEVKLKDLYTWNIPKWYWNDDLWIWKAKHINAEKDTNLVITDWFFNVRKEYAKYLHQNAAKYQFLFIRDEHKDNLGSFLSDWSVDPTFKHIPSKKYFLHIKD